VDSTDETASLQSGSVTTKGYDSVLVTSLYHVNHKKRANVTLVDFLFNITQVVFQLSVLFEQIDIFL